MHNPRIPRTNSYPKKNSLPQEKFIPPPFQGGGMNWGREWHNVCLEKIHLSPLAGGDQERARRCEPALAVEWATSAATTTLCVVAASHPPPNLPPFRGEG